MEMAFRRTVIGSFPSRASELGLENAIKWAVDLQLRYGIEVITDGEQRGSLIDYFEQVPGLGKKSGRPAIVGKIRPMEEVEAFHKLADCEIVFSHLKRLGSRDVDVKITVTGPITLGFTYGIGGLGAYSSLLDKRLYLDLVQALIPIIEKAIKLGCYVQIDEPGLTGKFLPPKLAGEVLGDLFKQIRSERDVALHVCGVLGEVPGLYEMLLRLDVDVLSLAFSGRERENFQVISKKTLEDHGKKLGAGFISNVVAESMDTAFNRLRRIAEWVGVENIAFIHPDCGFRETPINVVKDILRAMKEASDKFIKSL